MVRKRTGMSKRSEDSFLKIHKQCHKYCLRENRLAVLQSIRDCMIRDVSTKDRRRGWHVYLKSCFPPIARRAKALIKEKRIKFVSQVPVLGNVYRVYSKDKKVYTVYTDTNECDCRYFRLLCSNTKEVTCEHVLACVTADACKLVQKHENDRVRYYLDLPSANTNLPVPDYSSGDSDVDDENTKEVSSGSDGEAGSDEDWDDSDDAAVSTQPQTETAEQQNVEYSFKE